MKGTLFFDGHCGMCTRSRDLLVKLDRTGAVRTEPLQRPGTAERLGIPESTLLDSVRWLDSSGAVYSGAQAANAALGAALGTRLPLMLYRLASVSWLQEAIYDWVSANRFRFPGTTPYCESNPAAC